MVEAGIWMPDEPARGRRGRLQTLGDTLVEAAGVGFGYDRRSPVVNDVDLALAAGGRGVLVGPNGRGKAAPCPVPLGPPPPPPRLVLMRGGGPPPLSPAARSRL